MASVAKGNTGAVSQIDNEGKKEGRSGAVEIEWFNRSVGEEAMKSHGATFQ